MSDVDFEVINIHLFPHVIVDLIYQKGNRVMPSMSRDSYCKRWDVIRSLNSLKDYE